MFVPVRDVFLMAFIRNQAFLKILPYSNCWLVLELRVGLRQFVSCPVSVPFQLWYQANLSSLRPLELA